MVTVWTTVFGRYHRFLPDWLSAVEAAEPARVLVVSDRMLSLPVDVVVVRSSSEFPEAEMRNVACRESDGWLWQIDVDDRILPDALRALEGRVCDVLQVGYQSSAGHVYVPSVAPNDEYLKHPNCYTSGSPFTKDIWERAGGFPNIAFSDWGFWRRCARAGAHFEEAGQVCYWYREEPQDSLTGKYLETRHVAEAMAQ